MRKIHVATLHPDCGGGPSTCNCEPKITKPIENHERTHTRVQDFFGGGGNDGLLGFSFTLGPPRMDHVRTPLPA